MPRGISNKPRVIDKTPVVCAVCGVETNVGGLRTHLQMKHPGLNTDSYVEKYGEFRPKKLRDAKCADSSDVTCLECGEKMPSHRRLMFHIKKHDMDYEQYHIKHKFGGVHPVCQCGCGEQVSILKSGEMDSHGNRIYAREYISGHNTSDRVGVVTFTDESKTKMRRAAIRRMERNGNFIAPRSSKAENELYSLVKSVCPDAIQSDTTILSGLELDIVVPSKKIAFEFNGLRFHSEESGKDKRYHLKKTEECEKQGYRLVHIWEDWWVKKQPIVESMILSILGEIPNRLYARDCEIREIKTSVANNFLRHNHIQGACVSKVRYGLFYNDELVSVMTFSKLRKAVGMDSSEGSYELLRYCNAIGHTVVGGASRLLKRFEKDYSPSYVVSYANRDWSRGGMYKSVGFQTESVTTPGYFYVKGKIRYSRYKFTKHRLVKEGFDASKSEHQIMMERGFWRIWNTGNYKFEKRY